MTSLTAIFGQTRGDGGDSEKLLELYWNRAELKKEFAALRNETFRLKDRIREEKGQAARAQQKLLQLENLLLDPEWVYSVAVFYQFRALNAHLERKVGRFAEQLKQQREQRQHRALVDAWIAERDSEAEGLAGELAAVRADLRAADGELEALRERYSAMNRFVRFFRKRATKRALDAVVDHIENGRRRERGLVSALADVASREAPDVQGLEVAAKRSINCMILAFAQQVYLHYREEGVAEMAHEAGRRSAGGVNYGKKPDCDRLLAAIHRLRDSMGKTRDFADVLQRRARLIAEQACFAAGDEAVPELPSVNVVFDLHESGQVRELDANLLRDNYWKIGEQLSR